MYKLPKPWFVVLLMLSLILAACGSKTPAAQPEPAKQTKKEDPAAAAKPIDFTIAHVVKTSDNFHAAALRFKEVMETKSGGQMTVTIIPEGKAGPEKDLLTKTMSGEIDGTIVTAGSVTSLIPEFGLFDLPFLFDSGDHVHTVLDGNVGQGLADKLRQANFEPVGLLDFGFRHLTNSQRPVRKPEDTKGLKVRVLPNAIYQNTWELTTGTKPVVMNWTDTPDALKNGQIDGQENPISILVSYKLWESQKYASKTGHVFAVAPFILSPTKFKGLTAAQKQIVAEAGKAAVEESRRYTTDAENKGWAKLRENGMTVVEDVDRAAFRALTLDAVSSRFASQIPADWIKSVRSSK